MAERVNPSGDLIDIALGFDANYAPHAAAALHSIARNAPGARLRATLVHDGIDEETRLKVEAAVPEIECIWACISDEDFPEYVEVEHFSRAILFRLGLDRLAPADCKRLIYVDTDTICMRDIRELWAVDLGDAPLGAVADCFVNAKDFAEKWNLAADRIDYFNSGILVLDLERVRGEGYLSRALEWIAQNTVKFADQDALNIVFWGRWHRLEQVWNVQRHMAIPSLFEELSEDKLLGAAKPGFIHFTGPEKPWRLDQYHPWSWVYWTHMDRTPFAREVSRKEGANLRQRMKMWMRWQLRGPGRSVS